MQVRVKESCKGFYGIRRRKEGEEFTIDSEKDFSEKWMEHVNPEDKPLKTKKGKKVEGAAALSEMAKDKQTINKREKEGSDTEAPNV
jgi:hypothetical protein